MNEYNEVERYEDEAVVLERYVASHEDEGTNRQHSPQIRFRARLAEVSIERVEVVSS